MNKNLRAMPAISLDVDWAPDFAIDFAAELLLKAGVRATWFATHHSPALERLMRHKDLFEIGIHPNFLPGTTHGRDESEVLRHCMEFVPDARIVRTHGLVQTSNLLERIVNETTVKYDSSLFLPHAMGLGSVDYFWETGKHLSRLPYMWEDDFEMVRPQPIWEIDKLIESGHGMMIFGFHPIHIYLNSLNLKAYRAVRALGSIPRMVPGDMESFIYAGQGTRTAFLSAINYMRQEGSFKLPQLVSLSEN